MLVNSRHIIGKVAAAAEVTTDKMQQSEVIVSGQVPGEFADNKSKTLI